MSRLCPACGFEVSGLLAAEPHGSAVTVALGLINQAISTGQKSKTKERAQAALPTIELALALGCEPQRPPAAPPAPLDLKAQVPRLLWAGSEFPVCVGGLQDALFAMGLTVVRLPQESGARGPAVGVTIRAKFVELDAGNEDGLLRIGLDGDSGALGRSVAPLLFEDVEITVRKAGS